MRHGEVFNPARVLYGRLPGYRLSESGRRGARAAAEHVRGLDRPVTALVCSPLQRTQESAAPFAELFGMAPVIDDRVIEPTNVFEGKRMRRALLNPLNWRYLRDPDIPTWGEPYRNVVERMTSAMDDAWDDTPEGDVVVVSHQLPIWITHLHVARQPLRHDPRKRRCALSSITSFERDERGWREIGYVEPAPLTGTTDVGAV